LYYTEKPLLNQYIKPLRFPVNYIVQTLCFVLITLLWSCWEICVFTKVYNLRGHYNSQFIVLTANGKTYNFKTHGRQIGRIVRYLNGVSRCWPQLVRLPNEFNIDININSAVIWNIVPAIRNIIVGVVLLKSKTCICITRRKIIYFFNFLVNRTKTIRFDQGNFFSSQRNAYCIDIQQ